MESTIERKIALLGCELRDLIEQNDDQYLCDENGLVYDYILNYVNDWIAASYPQHDEYSRNEIEGLIQKILEYVVREGYLFRDSDYSSDNPENYRSSSLDEINTIEGSDGAQDYGKSYRENGKFGSYPLHDDYSEEGDV